MGQSGSKRQRVWDKTNGRCAYCGIALLATMEKVKNQFCTDHIVARQKGGSNNITNLAPACHNCNCHKRTKSLEEFRDYLLHRHKPKFTPDHIAHLQELGLELPQDFPCYPRFLFWFEQQGI